MVIFGDGFDKQDSAGPRGRFVLSGYARREIFQNWMQPSLYVQRAEDLYQHWLPPPDFFSSLLPGAIQTWKSPVDCFGVLKGWKLGWSSTAVLSRDAAWKPLTTSLPPDSLEESPGEGATKLLIPLASAGRLTPGWKWPRCLPTFR